MVETNPARDYFAKAKPIGVMRIICAALALALLLITLVEMTKIKPIDTDLSRLLATFAVVVIGLSRIPVLILIVIDMLWGFSFLHASRPDENGSLLGVSSISSLAVSVCGFFACVASIWLSIYLLNSGSDGAADWIETILYLILPIVGVVSIPLTAAARTMFYRNAKRSFTADTPQAGGAVFYVVMKAVNIVIRLSLAVLLIISLSHSGDRPRNNIDIGSMIIFILCFLWLFIGSAANILEAHFVLSFKRFASRIASP